MDIASELRLSFYKDIAILNEAHGVYLVQHVESKNIFVRKSMRVYDRRVYAYLMRADIAGIPKIVELVEIDGTLHVIEEWIPGRSLREVLVEQGAFSEQTALDHLKTLCQILRSLHALSPPIVHRDIKPSNIILTPTGHLYLIDFNAAKEVSSRQARDTVLIGTCGYAAPEQYGFRASEPTADIYALGVLFNEMLTGGKPREISAGEPWGDVIARCVQMDPAARYPDADALLLALSEHHRPPKRHLPAFRSWLPPGFRTLRPLRCILAALWYALIILFSFHPGTHSTHAPSRDISRLTFILLIAETLWIGNYRKVWCLFSLTRHPHLGVRILGICTGALFLLIVLVFFSAIVSTF